MEKWLEAIKQERIRQDEIWGESNHWPAMWFSIIGEEFGEMCAAFNKYTSGEDFKYLKDVKKEAVQVAACCVAMLECMDRAERDLMMPRRAIPAHTETARLYP